jgi:hypothetical protein
MRLKHGRSSKRSVRSHRVCYLTVLSQLSQALEVHNTSGSRYCFRQFYACFVTQTFDTCSKMTFVAMSKPIPFLLVSSAICLRNLCRLLSAF